MKPQTIQIFLPDGSPTSIKEAELTNRLVKVILFPRTAMDKALKRDLVTYTGVYFLFGEDELGKSILYIGEGENCWTRIQEHHRKKDFWTHCVIATAKTNEFTKTDSKFLEHHCLKKANEINRYIIDNDTGSKLPSITESRKHDLLDNFENIKVLLSTLGYPVFDDKRGSKSKNNKLYFCKGKSANATCILTDEGYLVLKGSTANIEETKSAGDWVVNMRRKLISDGVLVRKDNVYEFASDQLFNSPTAASVTILGRRANGWIEWKDENNKTLDELERKK